MSNQKSKIILDGFKRECYNKKCATCKNWDNAHWIKLYKEGKTDQFICKWNALIKIMQELWGEKPLSWPNMQKSVRRDDE
jgi:hypothetical protein